jgi:pimeloyl-ACP methyl ester carboxylesterase
MATFVLVHPAWFGGWCWKKVTPLLVEQGHRVVTPTLTGMGERAHLAGPEVGLDTHIEDVDRVLSCEDLRDVILVGNSSGGMVIAGVADRVPERVGQVVYLDAFVPEDGQALLDLLPAGRRSALEALVESEGDGWLLPRFSQAPWETFVRESWGVTDPDDLDWALARLAPTPFGHFTQPVRLRNPAAQALPRRYIRCDWPNPAFDRYAEQARRSEGWSFHRLAAPHIPYITHPHELALLLIETAR